MPEPIRWTEAQDTKIKRMRAEGDTWDAIAAEVGVHRQTAIDRGKALGATAPPPDYRPYVDMTREALPPGHAETWGAIVAGTCLAGAAYPQPVRI